MFLKTVRLSPRDPSSLQVDEKRKDFPKINHGNETKLALTRALQTQHLSGTSSAQQAPMKELSPSRTCREGNTEIIMKGYQCLIVLRSNDNGSLRPEWESASVENKPLGHLSAKKKNSAEPREIFYLQHRVEIKNIMHELN